jgi:hypothetical protein
MFLVSLYFPGPRRAVVVRAGADACPKESL